MSNEDYIRVVGEVEETLPGATFRVLITDENFPLKDHRVVARISGKMRMGNIRVLPGDRVDIEISIYDQSKGRIVYRHKHESQIISQTHLRKV